MVLPPQLIIGYEVRSIVPSDWDPNPSFLTNIKDPTLQAWALSVHSKWRNLVRIFAQSGSCGAECFSSIQVPYPFVVAGGRFMEYYYWDSMWIVDGLLVSGMLNTTKVVRSRLRSASLTDGTELHLEFPLPREAVRLYVVITRPRFFFSHLC